MIVKKISDNVYVVDLPSNMAEFKSFNVADLYEYHPTKQLYPDYNSTSSYEEGGTDVGDQGRSKPRQSPMCLLINSAVIQLLTADLH